jgi:hypothetical protein
LLRKKSQLIDRFTKRSISWGNRGTFPGMLLTRQAKSIRSGDRPPANLVFLTASWYFPLLAVTR